MPSSYGGAWQELRALVATKLLGLAVSVHFPATMDIARELVVMETEAKPIRPRSEDG